MLLLAAVLFQATAGQAVATCRVPNDPQQRTWSLERAAPDAWRVVFTSRALDQPRVELPLASAQPEISPSRITLSYASANGGRAIEWTIVNGPSSLDLRVNHGLEVNVERDLDPAVDQMNTDGPLAVACGIEIREPGAGSREPGTGNPSTSLRAGRQSEWIVAAGAARSVGLYDSAAGRVYAVQTIGWARELTRELKIIGIPGRFAWGVEATPVFAQLEPSRIYGVGFAPVVWRWNFPPQPAWSAFAELSMGGLWTSEPIPEDTGQVNFTAHWGGGVRLWPRGGHALVIAYRFQHFSNGNQLGSNPGVNSHVILAGWSHRS
jgi:hypothetical protein